jgi:hypothetical protein
MSAASTSAGTVEVRCDDGRAVVRASVVRMDRFINLRRVRDNRWHDPIGDLSVAEATALRDGLTELLNRLSQES